MEMRPAHPHPGARGEREKGPAQAGRAPPEDHWKKRDDEMEARNCSTSTTTSRDGTTRAFRPASRWSGWTWRTWATIWSKRDPDGVPGDSASEPAAANSESLGERENCREVRSRKKTVKEIKVDIDKCTGCRACEMACSAYHATPRYSSINPAKSRIRVVADEINDEYVPIRAGDYTPSECNGRHIYLINGKEYSECSFCGASCPSRDYFVEPDSGLPLKCDMCESDPPLSEPMCVQVCGTDALTYVEREEAVEEEAERKREELEAGLESLADRHGLRKVMEAVARISVK